MFSRQSKLSEACGWAGIGYNASGQDPTGMHKHMEASAEGPGVHRESSTARRLHAYGCAGNQD